MIAQLLLTAFLALVLVYAWSAHRTVPIIGLLASGAALAGLYFVWVRSMPPRLRPSWESAAAPTSSSTPGS
jgi:hypothetical protein